MMTTLPEWARKVIDFGEAQGYFKDDKAKVEHEATGEGGWDRADLEKRLEYWAEVHPGFRFEATDRKDGFQIICPGEEGWPDGERHEAEAAAQMGLHDGCIVYVENGYPNLSCRHSHCGEGAKHGKKTWKDLSDLYGKPPEMPVEELMEKFGATVDEATEVKQEADEDSSEDKWTIAAGVLDIIREGKETYNDAKGEEKTRQLPGHVVDENILTHVINTFQDTFKAKFFVDEAPYIFLPDEHKIYKFLKEDAGKLLQRLHLRLVQRHSEFVDENLRLNIFMNGEPTHVHKFGCFKDRAIYVYNGRGGMFKITTDDIDEVPNGTDGVYMKNTRMLPWPEFKDEDYVRMMGQVNVGGKIGDTKLTKYLSACWDESNLTAPEYNQMVMFSYLALFLSGVTALRPQRFATGPQNSGKSTLWEKHWWMFYGVEFLSGGLPTQMRSLIAAVSNHELQMFDNIDSVDFSDKEYAMYLDVLCKCCTGGKLSLAQLYKDNVDKDYDLRCNLFVTARVNPIPSHRSDLLRRTIMFPMRKPTSQEHKSVEKLKKEFLLGEAELKLETLVRLQNVLVALLDNDTDYEPISEMASFEIYTRRVAAYEQWDVTPIWQKLMGAYSKSLTESDPFIGWIKCWVGKQGNVGRTMRPGQIHADLEVAYGKRFNRTVYCSNAASFGKNVRKNLDALGGLGIKVVGNNGGPTYVFEPNAETLAECRNCYEDTQHQSMGDRVGDLRNVDHL